MFEIKEVIHGDYIISNDPSRLDVKAIHQFLSEESYWVPGIAIETVERSTKHCACFGIYTGNEQVGFARLITDYVSFGYLADVYVLAAHRGQGLSKRLMEFILSFEQVSSFRAMMLGTRDAHELYAKYGFKPLEEPSRWMKLNFKDRLS